MKNNCACDCHDKEVYWTLDTVLDLAKALIAWSKESKSDSVKAFVEYFQPLAHPTKTKNAVSAQIYKLKKEKAIERVECRTFCIWQPTEELTRAINLSNSLKYNSHPWYLRLWKAILGIFC